MEPVLLLPLVSSLTQQGPEVVEVPTNINFMQSRRFQDKKQNKKHHPLTALVMRHCPPTGTSIKNTIKPLHKTVSHSKHQLWLCQARQLLIHLLTGQRAFLWLCTDCCCWCISIGQREDGLTEPYQISNTTRSQSHKHLHYTASAAVLEAQLPTY